MKKLRGIVLYAHKLCAKLNTLSIDKKNFNVVIRIGHTK